MQRKHTSLSVAGFVPTETDLEIFEAVSILRERFGGLAVAAATDASTREAIARLSRLRSVAVVNCFLDDYQQALAAQADFSRTREAVYEKSCGIVLGLFAAKYNPLLGLECFIYRECKLDLDPLLMQSYPARAVPVYALLSTAGFAGANAVALFPENFVTSALPTAPYPLLYFHEKFVTRFVSRTLPVLLRFTTPDSLPDLKAAALESIRKSCAIRVQLHEHFHGTGPLSLPDGLQSKSLRSTGALEELRVDTLAALTCWEFKSTEEERSTLSGYIIAERLLYCLEADPHLDYDALSSAFLYHWCKNLGAIVVLPSGILRLNLPLIIEALRNLRTRIAAVEQEALSCDVALRAGVLREFAKSLVSGGQWPVELPEPYRVMRRLLENAR